MSSFNLNSPETETAAETLLLLENSSLQSFSFPSPPLEQQPLTFLFEPIHSPSPYNPLLEIVRPFLPMEPPPKPQHFTRRSKRLAGGNTSSAPSSTPIVAHSAIIPIPSVTSPTTSTTKAPSLSRQSSLKTAKPVLPKSIPTPHLSADLPNWNSVVPPALPPVETLPASPPLAPFRAPLHQTSTASSSNPTRVSPQPTEPLMKHSPSPSSLDILHPNPISHRTHAEDESIEDSLESEDADMAASEGTDESMVDDDDAPVNVPTRAKAKSKPSRRTPSRTPTSCTLIDRTKNLLFPTMLPQAVKDGVPKLPEKKTTFAAVTPSCVSTFLSPLAKATYMCITVQRPIVYERSFQLDSFPGQIREVVARLGWEYAITNQARTNIHVVMEFYSNFPQELPQDVHYADNGPIHVSVRGKMVNISPNRIREALQLPPDVSVLPGELADFHDAHSLLTLGERLYSTIPKEGFKGTALHTSYLSEFNKFLAFLVRSMLVPSANTGKITKSQASFIAWLGDSGKHRFPAEAFIFQAIRMAGENRFQPGAAMVFPSLITYLCYLDQVEMSDTDAFSPRIVPVTLQTLHTSAAHSDAYVEPLETTFLFQAIDALRRDLKGELAAIHNLIRTFFGATSAPHCPSAGPSHSPSLADPRIINRRMFMDS